MSGAELAAALGGRRSSHRWIARCPAHDDAHASLSIADRDGKMLLHCHAGCAQADLIAALKERGLWASGNGHSAAPAKVVATYDYRDERGGLLYQVVRLEPKRFRQRRPDGSGGWAYSLGDARRVPYRLPELIDAPGRGAFIVEGEKDCDNLARLGLLASTNAGGAGKWRPEYSAALAGRDVVVLPDNDEPGRKHAQDVARAVLPLAKSVRVVELPGLPPKGDVSDWLGAGGDKQKLLGLVRATQPLTEADLAKPNNPERPVGFRPVSAYLTEIAGREAKRAFWAGILREGEISLLVGRAMAGKSTFACALTRALTVGIPLLDRPCALSRVGYMALERNGASVARLLSTWKLTDVAFLDQLPAMPIAELGRFIEREIIAHKLDVVIVDHLQNLARVDDGNDYAAVSNTLQPFAEIAKKSCAHLLLLHHQGKTRREGEIDVMGSEAYRAAADVLIEATANDGTHFVRAQIRGEVDLPKTRVTIDLTTGELAGIDAGQAEVADAQARIAQWLQGQAEPATANDIQEALELKRKTLWVALAAGAEAGSFGRDGTGKRGDPFRFSVFSSQHMSGTAGTESEKAETPNECKGLFSSRGLGTESEIRPLPGTESNPAFREEF